MKRSKLPELAGYYVQLRPVAVRLDPLMRELPSIDDEWYVSKATLDLVEISNPRTGHVVRLSPEYLHHFDSEPLGATPPRARLELNMQLYLRDARAWFEKTQPGVRRPFPEPEVMDVEVDIDFPNYTGLSDSATANGQRLYWSRSTRVARMRHDGWEIFESLEDDGRIYRFSVPERHDRLVLMCKSEAIAPA